MAFSPRLFLVQHHAMFHKVTSSGTFRASKCWNKPQDEFKKMKYIWKKLTTGATTYMSAKYRDVDKSTQKLNSLLLH